MSILLVNLSSFDSMKTCYTLVSSNFRYNCICLDCFNTDPLSDTHLLVLAISLLLFLLLLLRELIQQLLMHHLTLGMTSLLCLFTLLSNFLGNTFLTLLTLPVKVYMCMVDGFTCPL